MRDNLAEPGRNAFGGQFIHQLRHFILGRLAGLEPFRYVFQETGDGVRNSNQRFLFGIALAVGVVQGGENCGVTLGAVGWGQGEVIIPAAAIRPPAAGRCAPGSPPDAPASPCPAYGRGFW